MGAPMKYLMLLMLLSVFAPGETPPLARLAGSPRRLSTLL